MRSIYEYSARVYCTYIGSRPKSNPFFVFVAVQRSSNLVLHGYKVHAGVLWQRMRLMGVGVVANRAPAILAGILGPRDASSVLVNKRGLFLRTRRRTSHGRFLSYFADRLLYQAAHLILQLLIEAAPQVRSSSTQGTISLDAKVACSRKIYHEDGYERAQIQALCRFQDEKCAGPIVFDGFNKYTCTPRNFLFVREIDTAEA